MGPSKRTGAIEDWLCALDTESSRQSAKLLRGRTACVDITEDRWFFKSRFPAETCGKLWKTMEKLGKSRDFTMENWILAWYDMSELKEHMCF